MAHPTDTQASPEPTRRRWRPTTKLGWIVLVLVILFLLPGLLLLVASEGSSSSEAQAAVGVAITDPAKITPLTSTADLQATVDSPTTPTAVFDKIMATFPQSETDQTLTLANALDPVTGLQTTQAISGTTTNGCRGTVSRTKKVYVAVVVVIGWRQVIQQGWCWNSTRITSKGATVGVKYHAGSYCYRNEKLSTLIWVGTTGNVREYRAANYGVLYSSLPQCGINPFTRTLQPLIYFHRGGGYNFGT